MRRNLVIVMAVISLGLLIAVSSPASAQGRPLLPTVFYTPPLGNVDSFIANSFEVSFVNTGAPVKLTIQVCTLLGACTSPGFACIQVPLNRGQGCSTGNFSSNAPMYAKFFVTRTGGGTIDGLGSLRVTGPDGNNSAAVQTIGGNGTEALPPTED